jgi:hypothetical protein
MDATALITTLVLAVAGPVGIALGWWLGRRSERDRTLREERKNAYVRFTSAAIKFRNGDLDERRRRRDERWEALAVLTIVASPSAVRVAGNMAAAGERLLDPQLDQSGRDAIYRELWDGVNEFTRLARKDLQLGDVDAFDGLKWIPGDRLSFERTAEAARHDEAC